MQESIYQEYLNILRTELVPAMGCTEPIAVAYCAALARQALGAEPERVSVKASSNIIKNVKSVIVPHTGGQRGIPAAAAAGIISGEADKKLEVLSDITEAQIREISDFLKRVPVSVEPSARGFIFDIQVEMSCGGHSSFAEIAGNHTNLIELRKDGEVLFHQDYAETRDSAPACAGKLTVERIVEFADCVKIEDVQEVLQRQIDYNTAIAEEGLRGSYGANIGSILLNNCGNDVRNRAKAYAAAGSDARMSGCELPVVINSGSGNQGLTVSLPVIVYAKERNASRELLYRALVISNLVAIHLKEGIGCLSAYCGATSAGCGAAAGISYLYGGRFHEIAHTIVNGIAIASGMICDGAKASCAAKIASAVEAGLIGLQMQMCGSEFYGGDGIIVKGVENSIRNIGVLAREGMQSTDHTIIRLMTEC
ncbi:MAG: serine dehydratase subunit alpha family protein [Oscillospiraceae bacterium]